MKKLLAPIVIVPALLALAACGGGGGTEGSESSTAATAAAECAPGKLDTHTEGVLTVATDKPAYPPYFEDEDPSNGEGFESAVAYAIGRRLGYPQEKVQWTVEPFDSSYAPGPKKFDFDVNQISITAVREKAVDFSAPYYVANQAVVALKSSEAASATTIEELKERQDRGPDRHHQPRSGRRSDRPGHPSRRSSTAPTKWSRR